MPDHKPVLVNVPVKLLDRMTKAAEALSMSRSALIRRALERDMRFVTPYEVARLSRIKKPTAADYRRWLEGVFKEASTNN